MTQTPDALPQPRRSRRFSLIWLIPAVAALSALWLAYRTIADHGPQIDIVFDTAEGLDAGHTKIRHKDVDLGTVTKIALAKDLSHVVVTAEMTRDATPFLNSGTRFWVVKPRVTLGQISGLTTILSGPYIEFAPGKGEPKYKFQGLSQPPVLDTEVPGRHFTLTADKLSSLTQGSPVYFHGVQVGEVLGYDLKPASRSINVYIFVRAPYEDLIHPKTQFWNASGFAINAGAQGVHLATESLQSLLMGGVEFDTPQEDLDDPASAPNSTFTLYTDENAAGEAPVGPVYRYMAYFPDSVRNLVVKAPVLLQGVLVGHVESLTTKVTPDGQVNIPIIFDIEPNRLLDEEGVKQFGNDRHAFDQLIARMVARGLRARLLTASLLTGGRMISLDFKSDAPPAALNMTGEMPVFPITASGDIDSIMLSAQKLVDKLGALPLAGLVDDIRRTIRVTGDTIASPSVKRSLHSLDATLANLTEITNQAKTQVGPTLQSLRSAASTADAAIAGARGQPGLGDLMEELAGAAKSLRLLADYLDRHPEALIQGKVPQH